MGTIIFDPVTLTLEFDPFFEIFNLANNFWSVSARALIFHMSIPCDKTFQWVPIFFTLWPWPWSLTHFLKTLTLLITFEQWVLEFWHTFNMSIPCDKTFLWVSWFFNLWSWPWSLTHFLKTLTLLISFEQWVLELLYFTWVFLVIRPFSGYHYFWPCDLDLGVWPIFWKL